MREFKVHNIVNLINLTGVEEGFVNQVRLLEEVPFGLKENRNYQDKAKESVLHVSDLWLPRPGVRGVGWIEVWG